MDGAVTSFLVSPWYPVVVVLWLVAVITLSIMLRVNRGKPIFPKPPPQALFAEKGASGRSLKSILGRIGGARNCLLVIVTETELIITPMFPFSLMFVPEIYGLDIRLSRLKRISVEAKPGVLGEKIIIESGLVRFELRLRNPEEFKRVMTPQRSAA